jgi:hypothetical protein
MQAMRPFQTSLGAIAMGAGLLLTNTAPAHPAPGGPAALTHGRISHVMVIEFENESESATFGPSSPAVYLNGELLRQGELIQNYFATSHVSEGNYLSEVSGQEPTLSTNQDCLNVETLVYPPTLGVFTDVKPGTDDRDNARYPGQVDGDGCVYPAPGATTHGARTIGDQLDALFGPSHPGAILWREYAEDMGADLGRDHGAPDPLGGADCAHPAIGGDDLTNRAEAADQYADRHNPFIYFHSVIDDAARCAAHVVPLGTIAVAPGGDVFTGHLHDDLATLATTPNFMFVTPNLCDDGHDATCIGTNIEGGKTGGLVGADLWLKHYMPMIFASPAYRNGSLLVAITFDEASTADARACPNADQSTCGSPTGPNVGNPGFSAVLALLRQQTAPTADFVYAGGGQIGAVVFNTLYVTPGAVDTGGVYNHYSALRTYEDLLGITSGGDDGHGHLGYAARATPFGADVFTARP